MNNEGLIKAIIQCIYNVRRILGLGYLAAVYKNALLRELELSGLRVSTEVPLKVSYKDVLGGEFRADIIVDKSSNN